jgi:hypothetical protein
MPRGRLTESRAMAKILDLLEQLGVDVFAHTADAHDWC